MEEKKEQDEEKGLEEKREERGKEESKEKVSYSTQTKVMLVAMFVLIASIFVVYWIVQEQKKFTLDGVEFYRQQEGSITYYKSLLGYVSATGEQVPFVLKLRTNPEKLSEIPVDGKIQLMDKAIITLSPEIADCPDTYITLIDMSMTLNAFGTKPSPGTTDLNYSIENNATLADCRNSLNQSVIVFKEGNNTEISQEVVVFKNCYIIELKDCEIREGYERFILRYITDSLLN